MSRVTTARPTRGWGSRSHRWYSGWGREEQADLVHLTWPDGTLQCELNVPSAITRCSPRTIARPAVARYFSRGTDGDSCVSATSSAVAGWATWSRREFTASPIATRPWRSRGAARGERASPAVDHRADGRSRVPGSTDARRGRSSAGRSTPDERSPAGRRPPARRSPGERKSSPSAQGFERPRRDRGPPGLGPRTVDNFAGSKARSGMPRNTGSCSISATGSRGYGRRSRSRWA